MILYYVIKLIEAYSAVLVIYALMSWLPGAYESKFGQFISKICDPYLRLFDRLRIGNIGFSVVAGVIVLNLISRLLISLLGY